jgi:hypothetical protein
MSDTADQPANPTGGPREREFIYLVPGQIPVILVFVDAETQEPIDYRQDDSDFAQALIYQIQHRRAFKHNDAC